MWQDLLASRELAWRLMIRDISAQYRQSFLGIFWAFVPPIVMTAGLLMAKNANVLTIGETDLPYAAYVMFSMTLWQTFLEALNGPIHAVTQAKSMLSKINFPREALILAKVGEVFFNFGIKLILIIGLFIWFKIPVTWTIILALFALVQLVALGTFIGVLLAPLGGLYQDVSRGIAMLTGIWLFLTPVIYPVPKEGVFSVIVGLNPVTPILVTIRELATTGQLSQLAAFWTVSLLTIIGLLIAWILFRLALPFVIERMSA